MACQNGVIDQSGNCTCNVGYWQVSPGVCEPLDQSAGTPVPSGGGGGIFKDWKSWLPGILTTAGTIIANSNQHNTKPDGTPTNPNPTPTPPPAPADNGWIKWVIGGVLGLVILVVLLRFAKGNRPAAL